MAGRRFTTVLIQDDKSTGCAIELPFDPKALFCKVRAPVKATINRLHFPHHNVFDALRPLDSREPEQP